MLEDGPTSSRKNEKVSIKQENPQKTSESSDDDSGQKKKDEKKRIFSFFEWMNAILSLIAKNTYHRTIWVNGCVQ